MCSLPFPKKLSLESQDLFNSLKICELNLTTKSLTELSTDEIKRDHAVLSLAALAVDSWLADRSKISARTDLINHFKSQIVALQKRLIVSDYKRSQTLSSSHIWTQIRINSPKEYLNSEQTKLFNKLKSKLKTKEENQSLVHGSKYHKLMYSFLMPALNLIYDADYADMIFDSWNLCYDFIRVF